MDKNHKCSLFSLYLAYFADYFSWGAAIAIVSAYLSSAKTPFSHLLWNAEISLSILVAAYPIGEVIGSPILGDLSDSMGRKKILIWGLWGSIVSMLFSAVSLLSGSFVFFVICQFLIGFFSGKQAMAQAAIVETHVGGKGQKLAFLSVLGGAAWLSGPFLGNLLMEEPYISLGGLIWPNLLAMLVYLISLLCTHFCFTDTYLPTKQPFTPLKLMGNITDLFVLPWKESLFFLFFLNLLGWYLLAVSLSNFLIVRFHLTESQLGFFNNYLSFCFTVGGIIGTVWILHRWKAKNILFWALVLGAISIFLLFGADKVGELWTYLAIPAFTEAWIYPAYETVLSDQTSVRNQGKLFGVIGASNGACQYVATVILYGVSSKFSILFASLLFLCSAALLSLLIRKRKRDRQLPCHKSTNCSLQFPVQRA